MKKITLKDLHEINNKYPELRDIHLSHKYDMKTKQWKFDGYTCSKCNRTFKREGVIPEHEASCRPLLKLNREEEEYKYVLTKNNEKWKPFI